MILHLLTPAGALTPSRSDDGTTWRPLPLLKSACFRPASLPATRSTRDGTVEIQTLVPGFFGLLPDTVPPTQPPGFSGHFVKGALVLSWQAATDNSGNVASYQVLLDGTAVSTLPAKKRRVTVRLFHPTGPTVYRVRAVDGSGIFGKPTRRGRRRPGEAARESAARPPALGAGRSSRAQHSGGPRPQAAPRKLPAWYWQWAAWRRAPYRVARF